jgi:type 1 glutamine amidotransferase
VTVLASSPCPKTKVDEPMLWTVAYGKGRVVQTPMGHDVAAMSCVGFTTMQRSVEWAATGKVTITIPADFPDAGKSKTAPVERKN